MKSPIYNRLMKYNSRRKIKFTAPGHKSKVRMRTESLCRLDLPYYQYFENGESTTTAIRAGEEQIAGIFGAERSFYLNNGAGLGIYAAIASVCKAGDKIIVDPECDRAVINALTLLALIPVFIKRSYNLKYDINGGINTEELEYLSEQHHDAKAMIITSPTYFGVCANIAKAAEIAHENNMVLIVDESLGAHFNFYDSFPEPALLHGADIVVHSCSETLGGFCGSGLLHINSKLVSPESVEEQLQMYQGSGGSSAFVCATENAIYYAFENGKKYQHLFREIERGKQLMNRNTDILWFDVEYNNGSNIDETDITKIVLNFSKVDISADDAAKILLRRYAIEADAVDGDNLVFSVSLYNTPTEMRRLVNSCMSIAKLASTKISIEDDEKTAPSRKRVQVMPFKAFNCDGEKVDFETAAGRLCRKIIYKIPQGTPIIIPGEKITQRHIDTIASILSHGGKVEGIDGQNRIEVLELGDSFYV
ncbi:MAG: PLP-dependent transferase [Clostridia bacterium]|nr:PLP-dependent transferase [Clostridia bacterium]